jgi:hypothetical protein
MPQQDLETRVQALESQIKNLQMLLDIEEMKRLQAAYGYYLEHWMSDEVIDCFADSPNASLSLYEGTWLGKEGIRRYFDRHQEEPPDFIHQVMQITPFVDVEPDGKTGHGRWYSWGCVAVPMPNGVRQFFMGGIYECEYLKQDGKWKILKLKYSLTFSCDPTKGWVEPEKVAKIDSNAKREFNGPKPDIAPGGMDSRYPSGYIFPMHFKHPVTGKETSENKRNAKLKYIPNRFARET